MAEPAIPVIDIGPYRAGDPAGTKRVADAVGAACERIGFLVIAGHGIPDALVRRVFDVSLLHPNYDARVTCLPTCTDAAHPPRYAPILAGEHMLAKLERRETRAAV